MIAIAFGPATMAEALADLPRVRAEADCIELRLDHFVEPFDLESLLRARGDVPVVATLRPPDQGGRSPLTAPERLKVLREAAERGAEYVDLEWDAATPQAVAEIKGAGASVIVSRHDFRSMPPELESQWWDDLAARGADVVKVVGTANDASDCLPVLRVLARADRPTIAIAMGQPGLLTRVLALRSDQCLLTYAALTTGSGTAPGQLTASEMRDVFRADRIGSTTAVFGLLGAHLESDRLRDYNAWFASDAVDAVAVPVIADSDSPSIVSAFRELPVCGWHVHGQEMQSTVGQALDDLSAGACRQGKVNAIILRDGALAGHWVESPREQYELWRTATG